MDRVAARRARGVRELVVGSFALGVAIRGGALAGTTSIGVGASFRREEVLQVVWEVEIVWKVGDDRF